MGFNTVAVIYNDHVHRLVRDGCFGAAVARAIQYWPARNTDRLVTDFGAGIIVSQDHADNSQVVIVGHNSGQMAREATNLDPWALRQMAECLERHGYKVTKPRKTKTASGIEAPSGRQDAPAA